MTCTKDKIGNEFFSLFEGQLELFKSEIELLESRIFHLENLQYRLRQFSITLWLAILGVGLGVIPNRNPELSILVVSGLIPILFMILDALYARAAQPFRSRRNEITHFINFKGDERFKENIKRNLKNFCLPFQKFPILDLSGYLTVNIDPQTIYRKSWLVKLTRTTRVIFYGFQVVGSSLGISIFLYNKFRNYAYCLIILFFPLVISFLHFLRHIKRRKFLNSLPPDYHKHIDGHADRPAYLKP